LFFHHLSARCWYLHKACLFFYHQWHSHLPLCPKLCGGFHKLRWNSTNCCCFFCELIVWIEYINILKQDILNTYRSWLGWSKVRVPNLFSLFRMRQTKISPLQFIKYKVVGFRVTFGYKINVCKKGSI
jgi:hypothetical protein